jgi:hypothetical protein
MKKLDFLRYVITLPADIVSLLIVLFIRVAWGSRLNVESGCIVVTLSSGSWPMRAWYRGWAGTTFCHSIMLAPLTPDGRARVLAHELVHVEQVEARMLAGLLFGIVIAATWHPVAGVIAWALSSVLNYVAAGVVAVLRGKSFYRGNAYEVAAYDHGAVSEKSGTRVAEVKNLPRRDP